MKGTAFLALATLVPGLFLMQATGGTAVAVIDFDRAIRETSEGREAIEKLTTFGNEQRTAIDQKLREVNDLATRLRAQDSVLSTAARAQLNQDLEEAQLAAQSMQEEAQSTVAQMQQELLGPVEQKTVAAVNTYANERGLKIVLDSSVLRTGLVFVHDTSDITTEIIRRIAANAQESGQQNAFAAPQNESLSDRFQQRIRTRQWFDVDLFNARSEARQTEE